MSTTTTLTSNAPATPTNPGWRLRYGRIPAEYQWQDDKDPGATGWWMEGWDLEAVDERWPAEYGHGGNTDIAYGKAWARNLIEAETSFHVAGWRDLYDADDQWLEPRLQIMRHTLKIWQGVNDDESPWVIKTIDRQQVREVIGKLANPNDVIEVPDERGITYVPVRTVTALHLSKVTEDVP